MPYSDYRPDLMGSATLTPVGQLRGGLHAELHAGLHGRGVRRGRHRLDQDRLPLRHRLRARAVHRPQGPGLHHGRGLQRRDAGGQVGVQAQHPPLEPLALHRRGEGLPGARRHHHHPLRRPPAGLARHPPADLLRERVRVPRAGRPDRHLRLRGDPREPEDRDRAGARRALAGGAADAWCARASRSGCRSRPTTSGATRPTRSIARCGWRRARPIAGLPATLRFAPGSFAAVADGLQRARTPATSSSACSTRTARSCAASNPLRVVAKDAPLVHFWGDTHGQSNETLGTNDGARTISSSAATRPSSTSWATRATTSRSPARSGAS